MTDQGPSGAPTPPHGTPVVGDPTAAVPPAGSSVFGEDAGAGAGAEPTVVVPPVPVPATPGGPGGPEGPGGPDEPTGEGEDDERPWYAHPAAITTAALLGLGALIVVLVLALGGDGDDGPTTTTTTTTTTTSTTVATTESRCRAGDQGACDEFSDEQLEVLCNEGVAAACQVLISRSADTVPDQTAPVPAPTDVELCRDGDAPACGRLDDGDVIALCRDGAEAACDEESRRFDDAEYIGYLEECREGIDSSCEELTDDDLVDLCNDGVTAACLELEARTSA